LPAERFGQAIWTGLRYARHNRHLRGTLMRAVGFFLFASAYWALLPLVAREQIAGGPGVYGVLLGFIGVGAVGGAFFLPWLKSKLGPDRLMALGALGQALAMVLYGIAREPPIAVVASLIAGASWIAALATLSVSAQVALPDWVRARGLALYTTVFFGCLTLGSAVWGEVAEWVGLSAAFPRRCRCGRGDTGNVALETANRRRPRPHAVHALAGAGHHPSDRARSGTGPGDGRIPHPSAGPCGVSASHRQA
jgi:predicted MFS family arabinose efflux permease